MGAPLQNSRGFIATRYKRLLGAGGLLLTFLCLLLLAGCAEVTGPQPSDAELEDAQLAATLRHPYKSWALERTSRVFLRLLRQVPQVHGRTYPFLAGC